MRKDHEVIASPFNNRPILYILYINLIFSTAKHYSKPLFVRETSLAAFAVTSKRNLLIVEIPRKEVSQ